MNTLLVWFSRNYRLCKISLASFSSDVCELNISATYCDFFTANVHWFLLGFSLLHTSPRSINTILYPVRSCFPLFLHTLPHREYCIRHLPGMKPKRESLNRLSITLSRIFKVYQLDPSTIPTILDVSLLFINWYNQTISPLRWYTPARIHFASDW